MGAMSHSGTIEPVSLQGGTALPKHDRSESMLLHCIRAFSGKVESMMHRLPDTPHVILKTPVGWDERKSNCYIDHFYLRGIPIDTG